MNIPINNCMRLFEITSKPRYEIDLPNKVYIVYDQNGNEYSRHKFEHVWNSSPTRDAAEKDVLKLINIQKAEDNRLYDERPLTKFEQEYVQTKAKWQKYFDILYPKDKSPSGLDSETQEIYMQQMDIWMNRLQQLNSLVRNSVILGTYKPTD